MDLIQINNIVKEFGKTTALKGVSLAVREGEFSVLLGPSGCGKTTLLRLVAGLEKPQSGKIFLGGKDVTDLSPRKRNIAMVFQNYAIFPHLKVYDNIAFGLRMKKVAKDVIRSHVQEAMELMHIAAFKDRLSSQLSGGQRQRVAVARALAMKPEVLLMDEPLSNLDALLRLEMRAELKDLLHSTGTTTLYVTHDQIEAMSLADRIAVMFEGNIVQYGRAEEIYNQPATTFVGSFIGNPPMNIIRIKELDKTKDAPLLQILRRLNSPKSVPFEDLSLGVRAEDTKVTKIKTDTEKGKWSEKALVVEPLGAQLHITFRVGNSLFRAVAPPNANIREGDMVMIEPTNPHWFDANEKAI